jgi:hypothetical protein
VTKLEDSEEVEQLDDEESRKQSGGGVRNDSMRSTLVRVVDSGQRGGMVHSRLTSMTRFSKWSFEEKRVDHTKESHSGTIGRACTHLPGQRVESNFRSQFPPTSRQLFVRLAPTSHSH